MVELSPLEETLLVLLEAELPRVGVIHPTFLARVSEIPELACWDALQRLEGDDLVEVRHGAPGQSYDTSVVLTKEGREVAARLNVATPMGPAAEYAEEIDELQRAVLDAVAEQQQRIRGPAIVRSDIRMRVRRERPGVASETVTQVIDGLVGTYLEVVGEHYHINLRGLLVSRWGANVLELVGQTIDALRRLQETQSPLRNYSWRTLSRLAGLPQGSFHLAHLTITLSGLGKGLFPVDGETRLGLGWVVPDDPDIVLERAESAAIHVRACLAVGKADAPSETATLSRRQRLTNGEMPRFRKAKPAWDCALPHTQEVGAKTLAKWVGKVEVLLLTAVGVEHAALLRLMKPPGRARAVVSGSLGGGRRYYVGRLGRYLVALIRCRPGSGGRDGSLLTVREAVREWTPRAIVATGIAFGGYTAGLKIGDVLVSTRLCLYEPQRVQKGGGVERGAAPDAGKVLLAQFGDPKGWTFRRPDKKVCHVREGGLLSGEKLVDDLDFKTALFDRFPEAIGGEMEASGLYSAAADAHIHEWIVVKAVCDWADGSKGKSYQPLAAAAAASLVEYVFQRKDALTAIPWAAAKEEKPRPKKAGRARSSAPVSGSVAQTAFRLEAGESADGVTLLENQVENAHLPATLHRAPAPVGTRVVAPSATASSFHPHHLTWQVPRAGRRPIRVYVIEPSEYGAAHHTAVFGAAMSYLLVPAVERLDAYPTSLPIESAEAFDVVVFPEAFLASDDLVAFLRLASVGPPMGCVHLGLRPPGPGESHMFSIAQIRVLVRALIELPSVVAADLDAISAWLVRHAHERRPVNLGCLFTKDSSDRIRVCLHPKIVRSRWEFGRIEENQMLEGDLLTLVTLRPTDPSLTSITIQPLLCSDALELETDSPHGCPLPAVSSSTCCFPEPPDTVDIVTVAACSPQTPQENAERDRASGGRTPLRWHREYLNSFERAALAPQLHRHHRAVFVLANYRLFPAAEGKPAKPAGLSGAFVPLDLSDTKFTDYVSLYLYGRSSGEENRWIAADGALPPSWSTGAYIVALSPFSTTAVTATMFGFTIDRLPRETNRLRGIKGVTNPRLCATRDTNDDGSYEFIRVDR